ncbi:hypothetical protein ZHAS_00015845 [Anopheles sinensis]|uniref:Uncharacterized protein n=1 Tax=Anopheles sinensis TaxID=74873 RepID=A0A084WC30_ANOSI|nr:hypothetical protein ZHAS_00015845 [Anopheles sinensis]
MLRAPGGGTTSNTKFNSNIKERSTTYPERGWELSAEEKNNGNGRLLSPVKFELPNNVPAPPSKMRGATKRKGR